MVSFVNQQENEGLFVDYLQELTQYVSENSFEIPLKCWFPRKFASTAFGSQSDGPPV